VVLHPVSRRGVASLLSEVHAQRVHYGVSVHGLDLRSPFGASPLVKRILNRGQDLHFILVDPLRRDVTPSLAGLGFPDGGGDRGLVLEVAERVTGQVHLNLSLSQVWSTKVRGVLGAVRWVADTGSRLRVCFLI